MLWSNLCCVEGVSFANGIQTQIVRNINREPIAAAEFGSTNLTSAAANVSRGGLVQKCGDRGLGLKCLLDVSAQPIKSVAAGLVE